MINYKKFIKNNINEDTITFTYGNGSEEQTVVISGSGAQLKKVKTKLPPGTKMIKSVDGTPDGAMEISASEWLKIQ